MRGPFRDTIVMQEDLTMKSERHLLLWERMGDYHRARWKALSAWIGGSQCFAADLGSADELYQWHQTDRDPNHAVLVNKPVEQVGGWEAFRAFRRLVLQKKITHVSIPGYGCPAYLLMLAWSRLTGRRVLMFAESWYPGSSLADRVKGAMLRILTHRCLVSGEKARSHFVERLKYPANRLQTGYSVVDNYHFLRKAGKENETLSSEEKLPELLCVARFVTDKNLVMLIKAFKKSVLARKWKLVLVGGGPLRGDLEELGRDSRVEVREWVDYAGLPDLYRRSACFVLPSLFVPWGLVVNEAMASGLPVLLSTSVGASPDLLEEGENGWSFDPGKVNELTQVLDRVAATPMDRLEQMGQRSREIVRHYSLEAWASSVAQGRYCWKKMESVGTQMALSRGAH